MKEFHLIQFPKALLKVGLEIRTTPFQTIDIDDNDAVDDADVATAATAAIDDDFNERIFSLFV